MNNKLLVGNIPYSAKEENLKAIFRRAGLVASVMIIKDRRAQSKGYGFVTMSNADEATQAIQKLNNYPLSVNGASRNLHVQEASVK